MKKINLANAYSHLKSWCDRRLAAYVFGVVFGICLLHWFIYSFKTEEAVLFV